jgi:hypothetical protein
MEQKSAQFWEANSREKVGQNGWKEGKENNCLFKGFSAKKEWTFGLI